ncbi:MAG: PIN domain-containing protein [Thaumarchaeota archaeon]|nr:PIN domain-containing protein [Nitrososphaerota archaeon]
MVLSAVLDTNIFLNVKKEEALFEDSSTVMDAADASRFVAVVSTVTLAELSTGYNLRGNGAGKRELFDHLLTSDGYHLVPVDVATADLSGEIRAKAGVSLPDAIIVSTGLLEGASYIVTHDKEFEKTKAYLQPISARDFMEKIGDSTLSPQG